MQSVGTTGRGVFVSVALTGLAGGASVPAPPAQARSSAVGDDFADPTRPVQAAMDRADAAAVGRSLCASAIAVRPGRWYLIAFAYMPVRGFERKAYDALQPGGLVVSEAFDGGGDPARAGADVYFGAGEMRRLFASAGFEIVRYGEPTDVADYGLRRVPPVRLVARRPVR